MEERIELIDENITIPKLFWLWFCSTFNVFKRFDKIEPVGVARVLQLGDYFIAYQTIDTGTDMIMAFGSGSLQTLAVWDLRDTIKDLQENCIIEYEEKGS